MSTSAPARSLRFSRPFDLLGTFGGLVRGPWDPTCRVIDGAVWRASRSPVGPSTMRLEAHGDRLDATSWGEGAAAALDALPSLVGAHDDDSDFRSHHAVVEEIWGRHRGVRVPRSGAVAEALVVYVLEQRGTAFEAQRAQTQIVAKWGEPAPGPVDLWLPPDPEALAGASHYDLHLVGVEQERADTVRRIAANARRLDALALLPPAEAHQRLRDVSGVGPWTAAHVALVSLGDADAVPLGDPRLPADVTYALTGRAVHDDDAMLDALAPYAGHRGRVLRLLAAAGLRAPEKGPRYAPRDPAV